MLNFIESYLKDRSQSTVINNVVSFQKTYFQLQILNSDCLQMMLV